MDFNLNAGPEVLSPEQIAALRSRLELLELHFRETLEAEKLEALAEWAAGAGHEINNPLAVITGRAQLLARDEPDPERRRELAMIRTQAQRIHEMIAGLMLFARPPEPEIRRIRLADVLVPLVREIRPLAAERQVQVLHDLPETLELDVDPVQLAVAIRALCDNALDALGAGAQMRIAAGLVATEPAEIEIVVSDNGPGIAPELRRHVFEPFFSGRQSGRGLGMGLPKCWRIVTQHGGRIELASEPGAGTTVTIRLPQAHSRIRCEPSSRGQ